MFLFGYKLIPLFSVSFLATLVAGAWSLELQPNMQADSVQFLQERLSLCNRAVVRHILRMVISSQQNSVPI